MRPRLLLLAFLILPLFAVEGQHHFRVLHAFGSGTDGAGIWGSVALDKRGNVYGTTSGGGTHKGGTVFRLAPGSNGRRTETVLHDFASSPDDGAGPFGGVVLDAKGNPYGTTIEGGTHNGGTIFRLVPNNGHWKEEILHNLCAKPACEDGGAPWGSLAMDSSGDLYGTGYVAFELTPHLNRWSDITLHEFTGKNGDGSGPQAGPIRDAAGNLYGTTLYGGGGPLCVDGCGTVWELEPPARGDPSAAKAWKERILHRFGFSDNDGVWPGLGQLAMDSEGDLYGAANGGKYGSGVVFKLARPAMGSDQKWQETILYSFTGGADGAVSEGVILDNTGNLLGTAALGGSDCGCGVVFKLSPQIDGNWKYTLLHTFIGSDGAEPLANLTFGPDGKLYGTTATGGVYGGGVVFELTP